MLIYITTDRLLLEENGRRLHVNRKNGEIGVPVDDMDVFNEGTTLCGEVEFLVGFLAIEGNFYLFFVSESSIVAHYKGTENSKNEIRRVDKVIAINARADSTSIRAQFQSTGTRLKQNKDKIFKFFSDKMSKDTKPALLDDILKLFNDSKDFYFCRQRNITISAQKFFTKKSNNSEESFFWNKHMIQPLIAISNDDYLNWTCPIMQGFVATSDLIVEDQGNVTLNITLISRRSTCRAGARYLRRGIDEQSNVANFVETEVILNIFEHELSYVQIRGSIPTFWSQRGFKYRPPLTINRSLEEAAPFFDKHFERLKNHYGKPIVAVSLVDQIGREFALSNRLLEHCIKLDDEDVSLISFDLHQHCRGLNFQKLSTLITGMEDLLKTIGFCWVDKTGEVVQHQNGVVRTNCIDCLDRTNLVQGQISLHIVLQQAQRLGVYGPLCDPPEALVAALQGIWADNGDAISTQYAGTAALKGDVTRSGERKFAGIMKDGYNSASRYYLTHTRDSARQKAINVVTAQLEDEKEENIGVEEENEKDEEENITKLITETIQFIVPQQTIVAGWGLINALTSNDEIDTVVILTREKLYVASYENNGEELADVRIASLDDIRSIEVGFIGTKLCVKIDVLDDVFIWKPSQVRVFNNSSLRFKSLDEANEYMTSVAEQINVVRNMLSDDFKTVTVVDNISLPNAAPQRRRLSVMGSWIAKQKSRVANTAKSLPPSSSKTTLSQMEKPGDESDTSENSSSRNDDLMSKFLKTAFRKNEEIQADPFFALRSQISQSKTRIFTL